METTSFHPDRRSPRHSTYDYSTPGLYYVTICTNKHMCMLGKINSGEMHLNPLGRIVQTEWGKLTRRFTYIELDQFVVMPDHMHGIIKVGSVDEQDESASPKQVQRLPNLGTVICAFKSSTASQLHRKGYKEFAWQSRYYDHIIRKPEDLDRIRRYILENPIRWQMKQEEKREQDKAELALEQKLERWQSRG